MIVFQQNFLIPELSYFRINTVINFIEGVGFQNLLNTLEPRFIIPSRKTFKENILPELYHSMKKDVHVLIREASSYGVTYDYWTSIAMKSYLTLTIHFLTKNFEC